MPDGHPTTAAFFAILLILPCEALPRATKPGKAADPEKIPPFANSIANTESAQLSPARQDIKFGKIYEYVNDHAHQQDTANQAQQFERGYHNYGAVTRAQIKEKTGHYFTFFWKPRQKLGEGRVVWDYLQEFDGNTVRTREQSFSKASGWQRTRFAVTGQDYAPTSQTAGAATPPSGGRVIAWRLRIYQADRLIGETTSFVW